MTVDDYTAIVARGDDNLKLKFAPGSPLLPVDGGRVSMYSVVGQTTKRKWRVWLPPGTCTLQATLFTFSNKEPNAKVLLRMGEPPVGGPDSVTPENGAAVDMANVLAALDQGAEVPCYAPGGVGSVKLSEGRVDSPPVTTVGQWLYINALEVPGHQIFEIVVRVAVDEAAYLAWYETATWDADGNPIAGPAVVQPVESHEDRVLRLLDEAELVPPLMVLAGVKTPVELAKKALATGVWAGLLRLIK